MGVAEPGPAPELVRMMTVQPRVFTDGFEVSYALSRLGPLEVVAYDANGRGRRATGSRPPPGRGPSWKPELAPGVYFVRVGDAADKVLKVR